MCRTLQVHRSGFYAWLSCPKSRREQEDDELAIAIKAHWLGSGCVYGYSNITKGLTGEGWLYVTVVVDLFSRLIVGWSMKSRATAGSDIDALLMAIWRRRPTKRVLVHSDQGTQYTSKYWQTFLKDNNLEASMSRLGNRHDNAVAESFFSLLKKERVRNRTY